MAREILADPWVRVGGVATEKPIKLEVVNRMQVGIPLRAPAARGGAAPLQRAPPAHHPGSPAPTQQARSWRGCAQGMATNLLTRNNPAQAFCSYNKLKKAAMKIIASHMSENEVQVGASKGRTGL